MASALRLLKEEVHSIIELIKIHKYECIFLALPLIVLLAIVNPFAEKKITLAADGASSSWYALAKSGEKYLKDLDVRLDIQTSDGTIKNAELLADPNSQVNAAFLIPGALDAATQKRFYSLGSIDYEPIWIFYNQKKIGEISSLSQLAEHKIGVGPRQSGRYVLTQKLFALNHLEIAGRANFISKDLASQIDAMMTGDIDALIFIGEAFDANVVRLLHNPDLSIFELPDIAAYEKNISFLDVVKIPAGSIDILNRLPAKDISLIAITTTLAVRKDMHPGLQLALLMATKEAERNSKLLFFSKRNEFPAYVDPLIELSPVARHYYDLGPPAMTRYLPFWVAVFFDRFWVLLVTLAAVIYPLAAYNFGAQTLRRSLRHADYYHELISIEKQLYSKWFDAGALDGLSQRLETIEMKIQSEEIIKKLSAQGQFWILRDVAIVRGEINRLLAARKRRVAGYNN